MTKAILSVQQPYAWAIVNGWKPIENRRWRTGYTGHLLIHAGKRELVRDVADVLFEIAVQTGETVADLRGLYEHEKALGAVVGHVDIVGCVDTPTKAAKVLARQRWGSDRKWFTYRPAFYNRNVGRWWEGPYGFLLVNAQKAAPVAMRGRLGIWFQEFKWPEVRAT